MYCPHCGVENSKENKKCVSCHKNIYLKDHPWRDYFIQKYIGDGEAKVFTFLENFIRKNLYGILVTVAVLFTGIAIVTTNTEPNSSYETVSSSSFEPIPLISYLEGCWQITDGLQSYFFQNSKIVPYDYSFDLFEPGILDMVVEDSYVLDEQTVADFLVIEVPGNASVPGIVQIQNVDRFTWDLEGSITTFERKSCSNFPTDAQTYYIISDEEWLNYR